MCSPYGKSGILSSPWSTPYRRIIVLLYSQEARVRIRKEKFDEVFWPNLIYYYIVTVIAHLTRDFVYTIYYYGNDGNNYRLRHGSLNAPTCIRVDPAEGGKQDVCTSLYI